jgi:predicted nucleic acid-binding protein
VVTVGELRAGVLLATDSAERAARQGRLIRVLALFDPLPVDIPVVERYGEILATARTSGRAQKATDLLIVATAAATGRPLRTLDRRQAALAELAGVPLA